MTADREQFGLSEDTAIDKNAGLEPCFPAKKEWRAATATANRLCEQVSGAGHLIDEEKGLS
jgi:hypothetical protein